MTMKKYSFKTLKGIYLAQLPSFRYAWREGYYGRSERKRVNSYLLFNASEKTSKIINYEEARASVLDSELNMFVLDEHEKFLVAENKKCYYMDKDGNVSPYNGDIISMRKKKITVIPQKEEKTPPSNALVNWDEFEPPINYDVGGNKIVKSDDEVIEIPYKIDSRFNDLFLIYEDIRNENEEWANRLFGICQKNGTIVVKPKYDSIYTRGFKKAENLFQVRLNGEFGIITNDGIEVLPPHYGWIEDCDGKVALVDDGTKLLNLETKEVLYESQDRLFYIVDGWIRVSNKGIVKADGTYYPISLKKIENVRSSEDWWGVEWGKLYDKIGSTVCDDLLAVYDSKRGYGFVNLDSTEIIRCKYNEINYFNNGRAKVRLDTDFGYIDTKGNMIVKNGQEEMLIPNKYDWAYDFDDNISVVQQGKLFGCIDTSLNELLPCVFHSAVDVKKAYKKVLIANMKEDYHEDLIELEPPIPFEENGLFGYKRTDGKLLCPPIFSLAHKFIEGLALVCWCGKYGYLNGNLEFAIPPIYGIAEDFSEGLALVGMRDYINKRGECVIHTDHHIEKLTSFCGGVVSCEYNYCQPGRDNDDYVLTKRISNF